MSSDIKIGFALVKGTNDLISVAKAKKGTDYECIECHGILHKKGGEIRKHHFSHLPNNQICNISRETCLHYGAKVYLKEMLEDGNKFTINIKSDVFGDSNLGKLLKYANLDTTFPINSDKLYENNLCINEIEKKIGDSNYKADVLSYQADGSVQMVWEIKVEHEIEIEKRNWLLQNNIPFVEIEPIESDEDDSFQFNLVSYGNIKCFSQSHFSLFNKEMYSIYGKEIHSQELIIQHIKFFLDNYEEIINKSTLSFAFVEAVCKNYLEYDCAVGAIEKFLSENGVFEFVQTEYRSGWSKDEELKSIKYEDYTNLELKNSKKGYPYFKINDKYWVDNPTCFCGEFLTKLAKHVDVFGFSGKPDEITAISCNFFNNKFKNISVKAPQNKDIPYWSINSTDLSSLIYSGNGQFRIGVPDSNIGTVFNFDYRIANLFHVVKEIIEQIQKYCKIEFIVADSTKHNKRDVYGLRITGIYSVSNLNSTIIERVLTYLNKRMFAKSTLNEKEFGALYLSKMWYLVDEEGKRINLNPEDKVSLEFEMKEIKNK